MDTEACDILMDYVDRYKTTDVSDSELFSKAFDKAADRIMHKSLPTGLIIGVILAVGAVGVAISAIMLKRAKVKKEEAEINKQILDSDL